jgi:hypothetical protein
MLALLAAAAVVTGEEVSFRNTPDSVKFAVIGDSGSGQEPHAIGRQMAAARASFPFEFVIMLGDNLYGRQEPRDYVDKFERPYAGLLQSGVKFYAALGNHDNQNSRFYKPFNMDGGRYYTFSKKNVRFFVLDTNLLEPAQLAWVDETLKQSRDPWRSRHLLYRTRTGGNVPLRVALEPLLVKHGVDVVLGHDHVYERVKPQKGIT